jgi:diguanylate cyclase (GGDEF)-like protein
LDQGRLEYVGVFVTAVGVAAFALGLAVLVGGWGFGIAVLKSVLPGFSTMKPNTALAIAALGAALALAARGTIANALSELAAAVGLGIGIVTIAEYVFGWNLGVDEWLIPDPDTPAARFPGRPAAATATVFVLLGVASLARHRRALAHLKTPAALVVLLVSWTALNCYLFELQTMHEVAFFASMAVHTAAASLLLGAAALAADPTGWPVRLLLAAGAEGVVCRWLLPAALLAPPLLGRLLSHLGSAELYPPGFNWSLYSVGSSVGSVGLILLLAQRIAIIDAARSRALELSRHDPLTGLANRRAFDAFLSTNLALAARHHHALSLLMLDVDRFKSYNDEYGHAAGDEVLKRVAELLLAHSRDTDLVARTGGEEFAIVLPETDTAGATAFGERIRAAVEGSREFMHPVTVSIGIASASDRLTPAALSKECDAELYRAKRAGRNRVSSAGEPTPVDDVARQRLQTRG